MEHIIKIFENVEFGKLEVIMIDHKPHFPATECAKVCTRSQLLSSIQICRIFSCYRPLWQAPPPLFLKYLQ